MQVEVKFVYLRVHIATFQAKYTSRSLAFKAITNAQTTSEHPPNNLDETKKTGLLTLILVIIALS